MRKSLCFVVKADKIGGIWLWWMRRVTWRWKALHAISMCGLLFQGSSSHLLWVSSNENAPKDLHLIFFFPIHFSISNAKLLMLATVWSDFSFFFLPKLRFWLGWGFTLKYQLVWVDDNYWELGGVCPGFQLEFNRALLLTCALLSNSFLDALSLLFPLKKWIEWIWQV